MASIVGRIAGVIWVKVRMFDPNVGAATRWKKGVSGNRGGRPKSRLLSELLRGRLAEVKPDDPEHRSWAETIARNFDRDRRFKVAKCHRGCKRGLWHGRRPSAATSSSLRPRG